MFLDAFSLQILEHFSSTPTPPSASSWLEGEGRGEGVEGG